MTQPISSLKPEVVSALGSAQAPAEPCVLVIFGASGDLTKRLLMPAFYNLACDGLLPDQFAIVGIAMDDFTTESFREKMSIDIKQFSTRKEFDPKTWDWLCSRLYYTAGQVRRRRGVRAAGGTGVEAGRSSIRRAATCCFTWRRRRRCSA